MVKYKNNFSWRTAPRSIQVLLKWLPYFYEAQGQSWTTSINGIHPLRRSLRWKFENNEEEPNEGVKGVPYEDFIRGKQNNSRDLESLVRQQFTTAEQYGFMSSVKNNETKDEVLFISEAGRRVVESTFTPEDFLVQLLKMYIIVNKDEEGVFPFQIFIKLMNKFKFLSRFELTFMFAVTTPSKYETAVRAIEEFRQKYNDKQVIKNKLDNAKVEELLKHIWEDNFGVNTFPKSWSDYTDAFLRAVSYTNMFVTSGRGNYTKVRVSEHSYKKFELLINKFKFSTPTEDRKVPARDKIHWFGAVGNIPLPWDNFNDRKELVNNVLEKYKKITSGFGSKKELDEIQSKISSTKNITVLKDIESDLYQKLLKVNIEKYVKNESKTDDERKNILDRFNIILDNNDMSALWLEVNTWKSLVSLEGDKEVIPNFQMEIDLTPRAFAPGIGNTPDMEVHTEEYIIVPEVSLMTGKVQWEHEGSSVIDHVSNIASNNSDKNVIGLFISSSINYRTLWQFFILSKTSWLGKPIPVIPLTIKQYSSLVKKYFRKNKTIDDLYIKLQKTSEKALQFEKFEEWEEFIENEFPL
ncbi:AlwI family type II restriction endonuclease [Globicatella sulfidifaciens]|uniref:AlwI family type II restriction endonuclease n=1 Tax=Globicatella sulfidifaciens TaxID=136093 RepID=A0A7X8C5I8_9LACT|nr:AlwI family type II restriction endonuclease [Globicatella sulfidifaciens]NLJ19368.1 AlwI family type II restriction endonuclease [Globicatella sulfidifaciens]